MSPVGGLGINYAVQDAVVAANLLVKPLLNGSVTTDQLGAVQSRRQWPVRIIQAFQTLIQKRVIAAALKAEEQEGLRIPWVVRVCTRIPFLRDLPPRIMALGVARVRVEN
jgi:2-polyprenyl-6-methoxyphenol hydroxylase-like FAD-dependent oxidoreductase